MVKLLKKIKSVPVFPVLSSLVQNLRRFSNISRNHAIALLQLLETLYLLCKLYVCPGVTWSHTVRKASRRTRVIWLASSPAWQKWWTSYTSGMQVYILKFDPYVYLTRKYHNKIIQINRNKYFSIKKKNCHDDIIFNFLYAF